MPTSRPPLSYDVFVAPEKPFTAPPPRVGDPPAWDPTTSTLIFGARDAVLVDPLMTIREATALADWVALHERRLTTILHHARPRRPLPGLVRGARSLPGCARGGLGGNGGADPQADSPACPG